MHVILLAALSARSKVSDTATARTMARFGTILTRCTTGSLLCLGAAHACGSFTPIVLFGEVEVWVGMRCLFPPSVRLALRAAFALACC